MQEAITAAVKYYQIHQRPTQTLASTWNAAPHLQGDACRQPYYRLAPQVWSFRGHWPYQL